MTRGNDRIDSKVWLRSALLLAAGGAAFNFLVLWLTQGLFSPSDSGRLFSVGGALGSFGWALLTCGCVGLFALRKLCRLPWSQVLLALVGWLLMYFVVWAVGRASGGMTLAVYVLLWALFGMAAGYIIVNMPQPRVRPARRQSQVTHASAFGRVPADTVVALTQHVRHATKSIAPALLATAPQELRQWTIRAVLDRTLRDWWKNENKSGLEAQDIADLRSFVELAASLAAPLQRAEEHAVYRATLAALLDDWLHNWNADGVSGPPRR